MKEYLKKNKIVLAVTILLNVVTSVAAVFLAKLLQKVIDVALSGKREVFLGTLLFSIGYIVLLGIVSYLYSLCSKILIRNLTRMMRKNAFLGIMKRNAQDFTSVNSADYISALTNDVKLIEENYIQPSLLVLQYGVMFLVTLVLLFTISPFITLCLLGCMIVMFVLPGLMGKALQTRQEMCSRQFSVFTSRLKDFLAGYEVITTFQIGTHVRKEFIKENEAIASVKYKADKLFALNEGISGILAYLTQFSGLFIGAYLIIQGEITAGTLVALIQLSGTFVSPVMMILQNIPRIQSITPVIKRIRELSEYTDISFTGTREPSFQESITVQDLSFAYESETPVLTNTEITMQKGRKYAIVGKSGCGKSTLVKVLTGKYPGYTGSIAYDGVSMRELDMEKMQSMTSIIHQNVTMFDDTIKQNICLFEEFADDDLREALVQSGVISFLEGMQEGLLSKTGENGSNLSGGQRQRIAVARALLRHKPILILDEGTSAVDMQTAYDIESGLLAMQELTLITITHNLSADILGRYDQIIYMEDGSVAETGPLSELLSRKGRFYQFANLQK